MRGAAGALPASLDGTLTHTGAVLGTPLYAPPEQLDASRFLSTAALNRMLAGAIRGVKACESRHWNESSDARRRRLAPEGKWSVSTFATSEPAKSCRHFSNPWQ